MRLHDLKPASGSRHARKRVGRGIASGQGKTAGRGYKGAGQRAGSKTPRGFEGGQLRLAQRLPYLGGFKSLAHKSYAVVNVGKLNRFKAGAIVDGAALAEKQLIAKVADPVKLLASGELKVALTVRVARASAAAVAAVEAAGGKVELLESPEPKAQRLRGKHKKPVAVAAEPEAQQSTAEPEDSDSNSE